jgi:hypothetical protein
MDCDTATRRCICNSLPRESQLKCSVQRKRGGPIISVERHASWARRWGNLNWMRASRRENTLRCKRGALLGVRIPSERCARRRRIHTYLYTDTLLTHVCAIFHLFTRTRARVNAFKRLNSKGKMLIRGDEAPWEPPLAFLILFFAFLSHGKSWRWRRAIQN